MSDDKTGDKPHLPLPSRQAVEQMIERLRSDRKHREPTFAGRQFFERLLEKRGVEGVVIFLAKASEALDKADGLDLELNFDETELTLFKQCWPNLMERRTFLLSGGCVLTGGAFGALGAVGTTRDALETVDALRGIPAPKKHADPHDRYPWLTWAEDVISKHINPPAEVLIGAVLIQEGVDKWVELKLEQVADSVELLSEMMQKQQAQQRHEAGRGRA